MMKRISLTNNSAISREFVGIAKNRAEQVKINLEKDASGILNKVRVQNDKGAIYSYAHKSGLDKDFFQSKMETMCKKLKDGADLFKEIMEYGLNISK